LSQDLGVITPGLSANGKLGFDYDGNAATLRNYWPSLYNATGRDAEGNLVFATSTSGSPELSDPEFTSTSSYRKIYIEGSVNYARVIDRHTVGGMVLYMQKENQESAVVLPYRKQGIVGRVTYSFDDRYFLEGNFGYTGSETFAAGERFGFFPAVGVSYYISNESFYPEELKKVMNGAKIRLSAGRTGNDDVVDNDRFLYRPTFSTEGYNFNQGIGTTGGTNALGAGIFDQRFENNAIHWEIENKRNVGLDLYLFKSKVELTVDYFNNLRTDILLQRNTIPSTDGFHVKPWENYGKAKNWGIDGSLNARHDFGDFRVSARGTFTFARNKILEYDELPQEYWWQEVTGTRVGERTLYIAERLYTEDDFIRTQNSNGTYSYELKPGLPANALGGILGPGDIKYSDLNNDNIIDNKDKMRGIGHPYNPEINYGFGLNFEYKGFYLSGFFQGTANTSILLSDGNNTFWPFNWGIEKSNYRTDFLDRWTADNPSQDVLMTRLHVGYANNVNKEQSTWWLKSGNFLRFKNLEFGYSIPKKVAKKLRIEGARIYMLGYNLYLWDSLKLWDPEMGNRNKGNSYPMSRTFTLGLELNF
jgi:TonB-linked SusC/RagA family outer membrane protein